MDLCEGDYKAIFKEVCLLFTTQNCLIACGYTSFERTLWYIVNVAIITIFNFEDSQWIRLL
jgi:hypothetical protein